MAPTSADVGIAGGALTATNTGIAHELEVTLVASLVSGPERAVLIGGNAEVRAR